MLLLWKEGSPYWQVGLGYAFLGIGVGLFGTPASRSLTSSVPVKRVGMASGTADLQRDLGGAVMQSVFGALLTAGYAAAVASAVASAPNKSQITSGVQAELEKSFSSAGAVPAVPAVTQSRSRRRPKLVLAGCQLGVRRRHHRDRRRHWSSFFFLFPKKHEEQHLLEEYEAADAE